MRQFGNMKIILRPPYKAAPSSVCRRDLHAILDDIKSHVVLEEYYRKSTHAHRACVEGYLTWFFRMSHPIMMLDTLGEPPRSGGT